MNKEEIDSLLQSATFEGEYLEKQMEETHISWVLFSSRYVFKIKKPVRLSFLDFSTLSKRKENCERELALNRRFSKIYLDVLPVRKSPSGWFLGDGEGEIVDYAVRMERMDSSKRMDKMLLVGKVGEELVVSLAREVAHFHRGASRIYSRFDLDKEKHLFNDIQSVETIVGAELGKERTGFLHEAMAWSDGFLDSHSPRLQERIDAGFCRDLHGDLHCGNVFLYKEPVLFDCIEFNDEYREIDVLYEVAFLCMEMEALGHEELGNSFLEEYTRLFSVFEKKEDEELYVYYKCLRANVRAKVRALGISKEEGEERVKSLDLIKVYFSLMGKYMRRQ